MRKKKQLLKQLFSMALTFALLLGFVPGAPVITARAEGTCPAGGVCVDGDSNDHTCNKCGRNMSELCTESDESDRTHGCIVCGRNIKKLCYAKDDNGEYLNDADNNHLCDVCCLAMPDLCTDGEDSNHTCDICGYGMCYDENGDGVCDGCSATRFDKEKTVITLEQEEFAWEGNAVEPEVTVSHDGTTLTKDTDYTVEYWWNDCVGMGRVIVYGIGSYSGEVFKDFTIIPGTYTPSPATYETICGINATTLTWDLWDSIPRPEEVGDYEYTLAKIMLNGEETDTATGSIDEHIYLTVTFPESKKVGDVFSFQVIVTTDNYEEYTFTFQVTVGEKKDRTLAWKTSMMSLFVEYGDGTVIDLSEYIEIDTSEGSDLSNVTYSVAVAPEDGLGNPSWVLNGSTLTPGDSGVISITATLPGDDTYNTMTSTSYVWIAPREPEGEIVFTPITEAGKTLADVSWTNNFKDKDGNPLEPGSVEVEQGIWYQYFFEWNNQNYSFIQESVYLYPEHIWSYTADGNVLTAECTTDGCDKTVTMALEMASYFTGDYEPGALQGVEVKRSDEADSLFPNVYAEFEVKNDAGEYESWNDMMLPEPVNAGSYRASITFGGVTAYLEYEVAPKPLTDATVTVDMASTEGTYTGSSQVMPEIIVKDSRQDEIFGDGNLIKNTDYTITYYRMVEGVKTETEDFTNAGVIYVEVTGIGNYTGSVEKTYIVNPAVITSPVFSGLNAKYAYTASAVEPSFTLLVTADGAAVAASEYTVTYSDNVGLGTATITVTDNEGGNYTVSGSVTFTIVEHTHDWAYTTSGNVLTATCKNTEMKCPGVTFTLTAPAENDSYYDGSTKEVTVTQSPENVYGGYVSVNYSQGGTSVGYPIDPGTYTASLTLGEGDAAATVSVTYTINKEEVPETYLPKANTTLTYSHGIACAVYSSHMLKYDLFSYSFSTSTDGTTWSAWTETIPTMVNVGTLYVKVKMTSAYYEDYESEAILVSMEPYDFNSNENELYIEISDVYYTGQELKPDFDMWRGESFLDDDLTENVKMELDCTITYANNMDVTTEDAMATMTITGNGINYTGTLTGKFDILQYDITEVATTDTASDNWKQAATITAPTGYTIGEEPDGYFDTTMIVTESSPEESGTVVTYYLQQDVTGYVSVAKTITVYVDAEAPSFKDVSFERITATTAEISWTVTDNSAITECKYVCMSATEGTDVDSVLEYGTEMVGEAGEYSLSLEMLEADTKYYVYVAVKDALGNATMVVMIFTTLEQSATPTPEPTPTSAPTVAPTATPTPEPTKKPSRPGGYHPSVWVTPEPTKAPKPTAIPVPTVVPTVVPMETPSYNPETSWFAKEWFEQAEKLYDVLLGTSAKEASLAASMEVGDTVDVNFYGVKNWKKDNFTYQWTTSDDSIATVDRVGKVTMLEEGVAIIRLELLEKATGKKLAVAPLLVGVPEAVYDVFLGTSAKDVSIIRELMLDETIDLNFYGVKNWKREDYEYVWTSSDEEVATVDNAGVVTAKKSGMTILSLKLTRKATGEVLAVAPVVLTVPEKKN